MCTLFRAAVVLGQMLRQFLEANFRRLSLELNATQANIYQELTMLQGLQHDVKTIHGVVSQLPSIKGAVSDIKFVKDIFADTQYIKESQHMHSKRQLDTLLQLIQLSYSTAFMVRQNAFYDRIKVCIHPSIHSNENHRWDGILYELLMCSFIVASAFMLWCKSRVIASLFLKCSFFNDGVF